MFFQREVQDLPIRCQPKQVFNSPIGFEFCLSEAGVVIFTFRCWGFNSEPFVCQARALPLRYYSVALQLELGSQGRIVATLGAQPCVSRSHVGIWCLSEVWMGSLHAGFSDRPRLVLIFSCCTSTVFLHNQPICTVSITCHFKVCVEKRKSFYFFLNN